MMQWEFSSPLFQAVKLTEIKFHSLLPTMHTAHPAAEPPHTVCTQANTHCQCTHTARKMCKAGLVISYFWKSKCAHMYAHVRWCKSTSPTFSCMDWNTHNSHHVLDQHTPTAEEAAVCWRFYRPINCLTADDLDVPAICDLLEQHQCSGRCIIHRPIIPPQHLL